MTAAFSAGLGLLRVLASTDREASLMLEHDLTVHRQLSSGIALCCHTPLMARHAALRRQGMAPSEDVLSAANACLARAASGSAASRCSARAATPAQQGWKRSGEGGQQSRCHVTRAAQASPECGRHVDSALAELARPPPCLGAPSSSVHHSQAAATRDQVPSLAVGSRGI